MKKFLILTLMSLSFLTLACSNDKQEQPNYQKKISENYSFKLSNNSLQQDRANFTTKIVDTSFIPDGEPDIPPAEIFDLIYYKALDGDMAAYLSPDPQDGQKHPAAIWIHGGYGGIGDWFWEENFDKLNDQSGRALRQAGIIMMIPSFRGENANPGQYQMFYGELDDLKAALEYLKQLPYVDPNRIYLIGHSTGGTTVLLANEYIDGFRAAFSFGGVPDLKMRIKAGPMSVAIPFNQKNDKEFALRSPRTYITSIKSPTFYFEGEEDSYFLPQFRELNQIAQDKDIPFKAYNIKTGNHFDIIHPATNLIAKKILADTGDKTNISFSSQDIQWIEQNIGK